MVLPPDFVRQLARLLPGRRAVLSKLLVELQGTTGSKPVVNPAREYLPSGGVAAGELFRKIGNRLRVSSGVLGSKRKRSSRFPSRP